MDDIVMIEVVVYVDTVAIVRSASLVMGDATPNSATLERNLFESVKNIIEANVPHVHHVTYVNHDDC
jgi:hypothetical protein